MSRSQGFRRILVAVDGSAVSMRAAEHAARIAKQDGAHLLALHVVRTPPYEVKGELSAFYNVARKDASRWLKDVEAIAEEQGIAAKTEIIVGALSIVDTIIGYADTNAVDLIVTGTRGMTPSSRMLLGSVAAGLVQYASVAVLVVR